MATSKVGKWEICCADVTNRTVPIRTNPLCTAVPTLKPYRCTLLTMSSWFVVILDNGTEMMERLVYCARALIRVVLPGVGGQPESDKRKGADTRQHCARKAGQRRV